MVTRSRRASFLRGGAMRTTRLDQAGRPVVGDESVSVSKGYVTATLTANSEEGEAITVTNASGENCISESAKPSLTGYTAEVNFCEADFALFSMLTGNPIVFDAEGNAVGIQILSGTGSEIDPFGLEFWMGAKSDAVIAAGGTGHYGYMLLPFLQGGVLGDFSIANAAITFTISGMNTQTGSAWGRGPYNVQVGAGGEPDLLITPVSTREHVRPMYTQVPPPLPYEGLRPLLDPTEDDITAVAVAVTGDEATITPTPPGGPAWYDFGDGQWDYAETGTYTHTYDGPGTYTVVGYKGRTSATTTAVVS